MEYYEYEGKSYFKTEYGWFTKDGQKVPSALAEKLKRTFFGVTLTRPLEDYTLEELIEEGDRYKSMEEYHTAILFYDKAFHFPDIEHKKYVIPRLTSCYRSAHMPQKAIDLFAFIEKYYPKFADHVLLTSVAAAYCDLADYETALRFCERAEALLPYGANDAIEAVRGRIQNLLRYQ